jgi:aryl-alcohol dehydrogenase-like predicted oxidoreductase
LTAALSGTFRISGDFPVHRLGLGAMRLTGPGIMGPPSDRDEALAVLRRAVEPSV